MNHLLSRIETTVDHDRAEQSLEGIGQNRWSLESAALLLALTQQQAAADLQTLGNLEKCLLLDQIGPNT